MTTHAFQTASPVDLDVRMQASDVYVHASDRADTVVTITSRGDDDSERATAERVRLVHDDGRVSIDDKPLKGGRRRRACRFDVRVELPVQSNCEISVGAGDVETTGVYGSVRVRAGAGEVTIGDCRAADVIAGSGDVVLYSVAQDAQVQSGSGDVTVRAASADDLRLVSGTGDIRCGIPEGVAAKLDLKSGVGAIENRISGSESRPEASRFISIRAKTGTGDVIIERALSIH